MLIFFLLALCFPGYAQEANPSVEKQDGKRLLILPYPFFNDTIGSGVGAAVIAEGYVQKQMLAVGTALGSSDGTYLFFLMVRNYQFPWIKRLILDPQTSIGDFQDIKSYTRDSPDFPDEDAGSNDSSEDNFFESDGSDFWLDFQMKYLLPMGHGKENIFPKITLDNGLFVSGDTGGDVWNPLKSGRTYIEVIPFYRNQDLDDEENTIQKTAGIEAALTYDNTDFQLNPSRGSYQRVYFSRDWGAADSTAPYTVIGAEFSKYFSLGPSKRSRQRVIGFNFWTVDCLTWNSSHTEDGKIVEHRPPTYKGANLGGLWRLKGYPATRFNDRSAVYYSLEYRHILRWNPLKEITLNGRLDVDWFQVIGFGELGRVAPSWTLDELHSDMKWSVGAGLRTMVNNIVIRADLGVSNEDAIVQLFIGHPF